MGSAAGTEDAAAPAGSRDAGSIEATGRRFSLRRQALALALITLLALVLRVVRLDFQPLWWDEGYSVWFATHPLGQMAALTALDIHPPLYYALLRGWILVLGPAAVVLRLFSVLIGTLAVPAIYLAGRRLFSPAAAVLAALLLAINPLHIYYSQEVRMYGLVALFSAGILAVASPILGAARPRPRQLTAYVLLVTASLYTQYYAAFLPLGLTLFACWRWRRDGRRLAVWLAAQLACALLFVPWLVYATPRLIPYVSQKVVADADRPLDLLPYLGRHLSAFLAGHLEGSLATWWPAAVLLLLPALAALALAAARARHGNAAGDAVAVPPPDEQSAAPAAAWLLALVVLVALALGYAIGRRFPFFPPRGERLLLLALPPFTLLNAAALVALWRRLPVAGMLAVLLTSAAAGASLAAFYTVPRYPADDYRVLIAVTVQQGLPEDTVFCVYPWQVGYWRSYGDPQGPQAVLTPSPAWDPAVASALRADVRRGRVWFPAHLALGGILERQIESYLGQVARPFANTWYGPGTRLSAWAADTPDLVDVLAAPVRFLLPDSAAGSGQELRLASVAAQQAAVPAANAVTTLSLRWQAEAAPPALGASVRLVDALGQVWAQNDYEPLGAGAGAAQGDGWHAEDRIGLLVPAGTPPGDYEVQLLVRPAGDDRPLDAIQTGKARAAGSVSLYRLSVAPAGRVLEARQLPVAQDQRVDLGDGLRFLGYSAAEGPAVPGELRKISLFWQAAAQPAADYTAFVQLLPAAGAPVAGWEAAPGAAYPTSHWAAGTLMRTQAAIRLPANLPDGRYRLIAGLFRPSDGARLRPAAAGGRDYLALGSLTVHGRRHVMVAPAPALPAVAQFGDLARLTGYDLPDASVAPGGSLALVLYWQATATADRPYTVFVHLIDDRGNLIASGDGEPGSGTLPATGWLAGEYLADPHTVLLGAGAPPGSYHLAVGLYDAATGQRLTTPTGADQVILATPVTVQ